MLNEALGLDDAELSLLAVLMLRGIQTPGELKQRADRLHHFEGLAAVHETLEKLIERGHVARLDRRPGQKEERYEQLLGGSEPATAAPASELVAEAMDEAASPAAPAAEAPAEDRLERLERELAELRGQVSQLRNALGE